MDKSALLAAFRDHLTNQRDALERTRQSARAGTRVDGSHRPANRGERAAVSSQGYLALGLSQRIRAISDALSILERIPAEPRDEVTSGALVVLGDGRRILILPGGQGVKLRVEGAEVTVLSPQSPLVKALEDAEPGDVIEVERGRNWIEIDVCSIS